MREFVKRNGWKTLTAGVVLALLAVNHVAGIHGQAILAPAWEESVLWVAGVLGFAGLGHKAQKAKEAAEGLHEHVVGAIAAAADLREVIAGEE